MFVYIQIMNAIIPWSIVLTTGYVTHGNYIVRTVRQMRFHVFLRQHMHGVVWACIQWWTGVASFTLDNVQWHSVTNDAMMSIERTFHILIHDLVLPKWKINENQWIEFNKIRDKNKRTKGMSLNVQHGVFLSDCTVSDQFECKRNRKNWKIFNFEVLLLNRTTLLFVE